MTVVMLDAKPHVVCFVIFNSLPAQCQLNRFDADVPASGGTTERLFQPCWLISGAPPGAATHTTPMRMPAVKKEPTP